MQKSKMPRFRSLQEVSSLVPFTGGLCFGRIRLRSRAIPRGGGWTIIRRLFLLSKSLGILTLNVWMRWGYLAIDHFDLMAMLQASTSLMASLKGYFALLGKGGNKLLVQNIAILITVFNPCLSTRGLGLRGNISVVRFFRFFLEDLLVLLWWRGYRGLRRRCLCCWYSDIGICKVGYILAKLMYPCQPS